MRHLTAAWARVGSIRHGQSPLDGYKWRAERLALIEGSGYHPEADIEAAKAKQADKARAWREQNKGRRLPDRYKPENADQWVGNGYGYFTADNSDPGTVAFLDYAPYSGGVEINYLAVRPDQRGKGHARALIEALYDRYPDKIHWGKLMQPEMGRLYESFQQSHPEQTGTASRWY